MERDGISSVCSRLYTRDVATPGSLISCVLGCERVGTLLPGVVPKVDGSIIETDDLLSMLEEPDMLRAFRLLGDADAFCSFVFGFSRGLRST